MLDWSKTFENQDHTLGIKSLIENKVRLSLIPTLIDLFKGRKITVKWSNLYSEPRKVTGGGPQGGNSGILEYISLTRGNLEFLANEEAFKFVDDASFLEILNLLSVGLSSINAKMQVPSDLPPNMAFLPPQNFDTQNYLNTISEWTDQNKMVLNENKSKYMIFNYCSSHQFRTRLMIHNSLIEQVEETRLLGLIIQDDLSWRSNSESLVKRAYSRMIIIRKLVEFQLKSEDLITIYILYIRSVIEQSSVVWSSFLSPHSRRLSLF